jgi:hypothetical protein
MEINFEALDLHPNCVSNLQNFEALDLPNR